MIKDSLNFRPLFRMLGAIAVCILFANLVILWMIPSRSWGQRISPKEEISADPGASKNISATARVQGNTGAAEPASEAQGQKKPIKEFVREGGYIGYAIFGILIIAIFLVIDQLRVHFLERIRGGALYKRSFRGLSMKDLQEMAEKRRKSRMGQLLLNIMNSYNQTGDFSVMSMETDFFKRSQDERFSSFDNRMAFLADTAGGLGLLGTVYGIYLTFSIKGGLTLDKSEVLQNMGLALVTTFLGIIVSIIVNFMGTEMGNVAGRRIVKTIEKIDVFREQIVKSGKEGNPGEKAGESVCA